MTDSKFDSESSLDALKFTRAQILVNQKAKEINPNSFTHDKREEYVRTHNPLRKQLLACLIAVLCLALVPFYTLGVVV